MTAATNDNKPAAVSPELLAHDLVEATVRRVHFIGGTEFIGRIDETKMVRLTAAAALVLDALGIPMTDEHGNPGHPGIVRTDDNL